MKTREEIIEAVKHGKQSQALDGRDFFRLVEFFPVKDWPVFGFKPKDDIDPATIEVKELTQENVLKQLKEDLDFAFEKALNQRGISASLMYEVIKMWMWVLEDELMNYSDDAYSQYGLPLFKQVAVKYGFENPIGEDYGDEYKYSSSAC